MIEKSLLSVILPTYNDVRIFDRLVFLQDMEFCQAHGIEVLICDDSTNDHVYNRVKRVSHYKYLRRKRTQNPVDNWNFGLDCATSHYTWLLHHDEFISSKSDMIKIVDTITKTRADIFFLKLYLLKNGKTQIFKPQIIQKLALKYPKILYLANLFGSPSVIIHKKNSLRYNQCLKWLVDVDYFVKALNMLRVSKLIDIPIISDLDSNDSISKTIQNKLDVHKRELELLSLTPFEHYVLKALLTMRYRK